MISARKKLITAGTHMSILEVIDLKKQVNVFALIAKSNTCIQNDAIYLK